MDDFKVGRIRVGMIPQWGFEWAGVTLFAKNNSKPIAFV